MSAEQLLQGPELNEPTQKMCFSISQVLCLSLSEKFADHMTEVEPASGTQI